MQTPVLIPQPHRQTTTQTLTGGVPRHALPQGRFVLLGVHRPREDALGRVQAQFGGEGGGVRGLVRGEAELILFVCLSDLLGGGGMLVCGYFVLGLEGEEGRGEECVCC